ncbi:MAG: GTP-binding protein [Bacteroidales bacterium]
MRVDSIYPLSPGENREGYIHGLLNALLMRTCFSARSMQKLGWEGINPICRSGRGWTFRIVGSEGIYGLSESGTLSGKGITGVKYGVYYFPSPDEKPVLFPDSVVFLQHTKDYMTMVREYTSYPDFSTRFLAGEIEVSIFTGSRALWLTVISPESFYYIQQLIDGEEIAPDGDDHSLLKENGEKQRSLFSLSFTLFEMLAATFTHNLDSGPDAAAHVMFQPDQQDEKKVSCKGHEYIRSLSVGYGSADYACHFRESDQYTCDASFIDYWERGYRKERPFVESPLWSVGGFPAVRVSESVNGNANDQRPSLIMLTGYLGSGKTTFLKRFIEYQVSRNRFVAVIQNEIGSAGLDGRLLEDQYAVMEMDEGCVCCSLIGELKKGIQKITAELKPDNIILETTGLANPFNLTGELDLISDLVRLEMVITMIDGANFSASAANSQIIADQARSADLLVLNKCDMITKRQTDNLCRLLKEINPTAGVIKCSHGDFNMSLLVQAAGKKGDAALYEKSLSDSVSGHHHTHTDEKITAGKIILNAPIERSLFMNEIASMPESVYRVKGVINFKGENDASLIQIVRGSCEITTMKHHLPGERYLIAVGTNESIDHLLNKLLLTKTSHYEKAFECSKCADDFGADPLLY